MRCSFTRYRGPYRRLGGRLHDDHCSGPRIGEDARFVASCLRVPSGTLRERSSDVLAPEVLARRHAGYRNRVLMGPSWRADVWSELEATPGLSAAAAARRAGCAFATAWQVKRDYEILRRAGDER